MKTLTYTYARRYDGKLELPLDLYVPSSDASEPSHPLPVLIWFHGGGLIQGSRDKVPPHIKRAVDRYKIAVVSPDYRLAPQVRTPDILQDVVDLLAFVFDQLAAAAAESGSHLDLDRIVLSGSSAGGWLALLLGLGLCPDSRPELLARVSGIAGIYPITTIDHPFFRNARTPFLGRLPNPASDFAEFCDPNATVICNTLNNKKRGLFYMFAQQEARFPTLLFDDAQREQGWMQKTDVSVRIREATPEQKQRWPPVYIVHGAIDTAVDVDQSRRVKVALEAAGHRVQYDEVPDKDHLWDEFEPETELATFWRFVTDQLPPRSTPSTRM